MLLHFVPDGLHFAGGHSGPQFSGADSGAFEHDSASRHNSALSNDGTVHDDGAHPNEGPSLDGASVNDGVVPDAGPIADGEVRLFPGSVQHRPVLDVDAGPESDGTDVPPDDGAKPDAAVIASDDIADDGAVGGEPIVLAEARMDEDVLSGVEIESMITGKSTADSDEAAGATRIKRLRDALGNQMVSELLVKNISRKGYVLAVDKEIIKMI